MELDHRFLLCLGAVSGHGDATYGRHLLLRNRGDIWGDQRRSFVAGVPAGYFHSFRRSNSWLPLPAFLVPGRAVVLLVFGRNCSQLMLPGE